MPQPQKEPERLWRQERRSVVGAGTETQTRNVERSTPRSIIGAPSDNSDGTKGSDEAPSDKSSPKIALTRSKSTLQKMKSYATSFKGVSFMRRKEADKVQAEEDKPQLYLAGMKKQYELNHEEVEVVERFGAKTQVRLKASGRSLVVDTKNVRFADNTRWDGGADEEEDAQQQNIIAAMQKARMREGAELVEEMALNDGIPDDSNDADKVIQAIEGPDAGKEDSEEEVDFPRPLVKGRDRNGGTFIKGDVDLEIIFDMLLREVENEKQFKRQLEQELADAVDCRAKSIHCIWLYSIEDATTTKVDRPSKNLLVARVRLHEGLSRHCRSSADVAKALWKQQQDDNDTHLRTGSLGSKVVSLRIFMDDTEEGRDQMTLAGIQKEQCERIFRESKYRFDDLQSDVDSVSSAELPISRLVRLSQIRDVNRRGTAGEFDDAPLAGDYDSFSDSNDENHEETVRHMIGPNAHEVHNQIMGDGTAERPIVFPTASMRSAGVKHGMRKGRDGNPMVLPSAWFAGEQMFSTEDLGPPPPRISKLNSQQQQHRRQPDDNHAASVRSTGIHEADSDSEIDFGPPPPRLSKLHSQRKDIVVGPPPPRISKMQAQQQQEQRKHDHASESVRPQGDRYQQRRDHPSVSVHSMGSQETDSDVELWPLPPRISKLSSQHQEKPLDAQSLRDTPQQLPWIDDNRQKELASKIAKFYTGVNPDMIEHADEIAHAFLHREDELNQVLVEKYGYGLTNVATRQVTSQPLVAPAAAAPGRQIETSMSKQSAQPRDAVNQDQKPESPTKIACCHCGICLKGKDALMCGKCHIAIYCSRECQATAWKTGHKQKCMAPSEEQLALPACPGRVNTVDDSPDRQKDQHQDAFC